MKVLDSGVFIEDILVKGVTTRSVSEETAVPATIEILEPKTEFVEKIREGAKKSGDLDVLSSADIDVLALALEIGGMVVTNDFAIQNVASAMKIPWEGSGKSITHEIKWEWYCPACWKRQSGKGVCDKCGTDTKRRPKKKKGRV
ncbi:MAG: hypothetical protein GOV01_03815 [Candidatus Altiarchaeota archaeon]|nr:hypothetical protein [Candidatus Altiarchaeota archaeon]